MATLKISDLSVGDWVRWKVYDKTYDVQVTGVTDRRIYGLHDGIEYSMLLTQIHPIPITAEILEKNGWRVIEKEVLGDDYEYDGEKRVWDDYNIDICETKPGVFWYSWRSEYYMWRLEYVHKLQHLIRLAGVDKEINL